MDSVEHMALSENVEQAMASWKIDAMSCERRTIPLVVHNGLQDLLFLLTHFHCGTLPETWSECKKIVHSFFPIVYDTKIMAIEYCTRGIFQGRTHLAALYESVLTDHPQWNRNFTADGTPQTQEQVHDAGYDSYW